MASSGIRTGCARPSLPCAPSPGKPVTARIADVAYPLPLPLPFCEPGRKAEASRRGKGKGKGKGKVPIGSRSALTVVVRRLLPRPVGRRRRRRRQGGDPRPQLVVQRALAGGEGL